MKYIAYFSCGAELEVEAPGLLKAIATAKEFKAARKNSIGDFFTAAPEGIKVAVPHITPLRIKLPVQLELKLIDRDSVRYKER